MIFVPILDHQITLFNLPATEIAQIHASPLQIAAIKTTDMYATRAITVSLSQIPTFVSAASRSVDLRRRILNCLNEKNPTRLVRITSSSGVQDKWPEGSKQTDGTRSVAPSYAAKSFRTEQRTTASLCSSSFAPKRSVTGLRSTSRFRIEREPALFFSSSRYRF